MIKTADVDDKQGERSKRKFFTINRINFFQINDTLYAAELEITQERYQEFLRELAVSSPEKYHACKIDTTVWRKYSRADTIMRRNYFQHPAFKLYPVVGISWKAANEYCKWLTEKSETDLWSPSCYVRLPTETEWKSMVANPDKNGFDLPCPDGFDTSVNCYCFNYYVVDTIINEAQDGGYYTVRVDAYWPNRYGIFNLHGNVAEMTSDENICKGGGWYDSFSDCSMFATKNYPLPSAEVGIRPVAIINKE